MLYRVGVAGSLSKTSPADFGDGVVNASGGPVVHTTTMTHALTTGVLLFHATRTGSTSSTWVSASSSNGATSEFAFAPPPPPSLPIARKIGAILPLGGSLTNAMTSGFVVRGGGGRERLLKPSGSVTPSFGKSYDWASVGPSVGPSTGDRLGHTSTQLFLSPLSSNYDGQKYCFGKEEGVRNNELSPGPERAAVGASDTVKFRPAANSLNFAAVTSMSLLALQFGLQPLLVRRFMPHAVCRSSVVLMQELVKFAIASGLYFTGTGVERRKEDLSGWSIKTWLSIAAIPAALYTVQNIASLLAYQNLVPLTFNVLNQTKTLSAALCCYLVMGKKQSRIQVMALMLLLASALVNEKILTLKAFTSPFFLSGGMLAGWKNLFAGTGSLKLARHLTHGVLPVLLASFLSGLTGALTQKNLQGSTGLGEKTTKPRNAYLFSMELNVASIIFLVVSLLVSSDGKRIAQAGFFDQWTPQTFIPIVTNSLGGIVVGLVTKYAGSVRKGFALMFGILLSGLLQAGSAGVSGEQVAGAILAALSLWLHTSNPNRSRLRGAVPVQ